MTQTPQAPQPQMVPQAAPPGVRPGGLTALAVLNFVFGGLGLIGLIALFALLSAAEVVISKSSGGSASLSKAPGAGFVWMSILVSLVIVALLIVSGVGYLGQKKVAGYVMGLVYSIVAIVWNIISMIVISFGVLSLLGVIYPVLTLVLLNTAFKKCFH
jgi:hypothetical protein